jgi:hypothetical protein
MDLRDIFGEGNVKIADIVKEFKRITGGEVSIDSEETESELISDGDAQDVVDNESSKQVPRKCDWIENTPEWNPPTHLALHLAKVEGSMSYHL